MIQECIRLTTNEASVSRTPDKVLKITHNVDRSLPIGFRCLEGFARTVSGGGVGVGVKLWKGG